VRVITGGGRRQLRHAQRDLSRDDPGAVGGADGLGGR
jgi:hypothetical protein